MSRAAWRLAALALLAVPVTACELTETTVAEADPIPIVQAVIRPDLASQFVILEWSRSGRPTDQSVPACNPFEQIPECPPADPIRGATVTARNLDADLSGAGCPASVVFAETDPTQLPGVYRAASECLGLVAGTRLALTVELPGHTVTGSLVVPGIDSIHVTTASGELRQRGGTLTINHDRDTVRLGAGATAGNALHVEARPATNTDKLVIYLFTDTLGVALPGNLVNPFEGDNGESVFQPGHDYALTVGVTDTNYYDFVRSVSDPFTGRGFINHLTGGIGVFGAMDVAQYTLHVVGDVDDPREGVLELTGVVDGVDVNVRWEGYLDGGADTSIVAAFVQGQWTSGPIQTSADGMFYGDSLDVHFTFVRGGAGELLRARQRLVGRYSATGDFVLEVRDDVGPQIYGTLTAHHQ